MSLPQGPPGGGLTGPPPEKLKKNNKERDESKAASETISIKEFETYFSLAKTYVKDWHDNIERWRRWYDFQHYTKKALPHEERYPDPTPTNVVDLAVGILLANPVEWSAKGWEPSLDETDRSSQIEKYLDGTLYVNNEREEMNIPYEAVTHLVRDGACVLYTVWDPTVAKRSLIKQKKPKLPPEAPPEMAQLLKTVKMPRVYDETPLRVKVIDPLQIYLYPGGPKRWGHIFRVWEMSAHDAEITFGKALKKKAHLSEREKMSTMVEVKDYWRITEKMQANGKTKIIVQNVLVVDDDIVRGLRVMNGYEDLPFNITFFKPISRDDPKDWHGILKPLETTVKFLEKAINRRQRQIQVYSSLPLIARTIANRRIRLDPAMGNLVTLTTDEGLEFPKWPGNAPDVEEQIGFFRARLQQAGFTDVMFGGGPNQVSGYALSQLGDQSRIRLAQPVAHLEMMWSSWARKVLRLTSYFTDGKISVRVYGRMKGQDFIQQLDTTELQHFMVKATVKPEFPNERVRNHAMAVQVSGILSERTIMERYLDIDQPDEEREKRQDDMALKHPAFQQFEQIQRLMKFMQSEDPIIKAAAGMAIQQMQQAAQGGGPSGPPSGGGQESPSRENALGLQSATGQQVEQAGGQLPPGQGEGDVLRKLTEAAPGFTAGGGGVQ